MRGKVVRGTIQIKRGGFGFVKTEEGEVFVPGWATDGALSGDEVEVLIFPERRGALPEGKVIKVVKHGKKFVGGTYIGKGRVIADDPRIGKVKVKLQGKKVKKGSRVILVRKGKGFEIHEATQSDHRLIELMYSLPSKFPKPALKEAKRLKMREDTSRVDLREEFTITIDPRTAKDYDDAIYVERYSKGWILKVHIADVSYWVRKDGALDKEALKRGTSVYLIDKVIPMLPPRISDDLASLLPGEPKFTFTVEMKIDRKGRVRSTKFYKSVILSKARFTYEDAERVLKGEDVEDPETTILEGAYEGVKKVLEEASELAEVLREKREKRGSIDFDLPEAEFFMERGKVIMVSPKERLWSHKIIEELMIAANTAVATYLYKREWPVLYRVHDRPDPRKVEKFIKLAESLLKTSFKRYRITPRFLSSVLKRFQGKKEESLMNYLLLRSMSRAEYSPVNIGHFGLALKNYLHFTSPIRRYPDLIAHRQLWNLLRGGKSMYTHEELLELGKHLSERERLAEEAEWELWKLKIYEFMQDKVGQVYEGVVTGISSEDLFVQIVDHLAEGYVPYHTIKGRVVPGEYSITIVRGKRSHKISLGDKVKVKVVSVNKYAKDMLLSLLQS